MTDPYMRAMFGCHAVQVPVQFLMQRMGDQDGKHITLAAALISSYAPLMTEGYAHELIVGDMVIRPFGRWGTATRYQGYGITGLIKSDAMFPQGHDTQILDNGWDAIKKRAGLR